MVTLLREAEVRHFKSMLRKVDNAYVKDYKVGAIDLAPLQDALSGALAQVRRRHLLALFHCMLLR